MKIDLHCHTKKVKKGDAITRNVTAEVFCKKVIDSDVKIVAITNHNCFDYEQYLQFSKAVGEYCSIWPGIELDICCKKEKGEQKRGHLIVIANPKNAKDFADATNILIGEVQPDEFIGDVKIVYGLLDKCDCIYIPHYHKKPGFSDEDIEELSNLLEDKSRLFKETADYRSLGVFSNFDYSMMIGSDVQDWNVYENSTFANLRLPIQTFEQFCLLARKDVQVINTLLNQKKKREITVSPCKGVFFELPFYNDINIIFGQKGTGKSEIINSLKKYCVDTSTSSSVYIGNEKEVDFSKLIKVENVVVSPNKMGLASMEEEFQELYEWSEELPTSLMKYVSWYTTKDNNRNKGRMKITESVHIEDAQENERLEQDYNTIKDFLNSDFKEISLEDYITEEEKQSLLRLIQRLVESIGAQNLKQWREDKSIELTNWSIDKIKSIADKCSDSISKPSSTGFYDFARKRIRLYKIINQIKRALEEDDKVEMEYLGTIEDKGEVYIQTRYRMLKRDSRTNEFALGIKSLRKCKESFDEIMDKAFSDSISAAVEVFREHFEEGIKDISCFIGIVKETVLEDGSEYKPSNGERGILLMQRTLEEDSDVYLLDEPELGMGNSYITSTILPKLNDLAKQRKMVVVATHNANIAVGTLPYASILRTHENGEYSTYFGNPFCDELVNIEDEEDIRNWTKESMHTLEGGKNAFYERKDIYESGRNDN